MLVLAVGTPVLRLVEPKSRLWSSAVSIGNLRTRRSGPTHRFGRASLTKNPDPSQIRVNNLGTNMANGADIAAGLTSLKAAFDLAKTLVGVHDQAVVRAKVIELQEQILAAQASAVTAQTDQAGLLKRVGELEKELADLKAWEADKQRYELTEIQQATRKGKVFVYTLKEETHSSEPKHSLCPNCYQNGRKSILQPITLDQGMIDLLVCQSCNGEINLTGISYETRSGPSRRRR